MRRAPRLTPAQPLAITICLALSLPAVGQTITIDNVDAEFSILAGTWNSGAYGQPYGADYNWALTSGAGEGWAEVEWRPDLPLAGVYDVSIWYVQGTNRAVDATFTVHHTGGDTPVAVNQQTFGETWYSLGTFDFDAGTAGSVSLHNVAGPSVVIADAIRFTRTTSTIGLTMEVEPLGWGTTTPTDGFTHYYEFNDVVAISAQPHLGYLFHHWNVSDGADVNDPFAPSTTVVIDEDKTVTAVFVEDTSTPTEFRGFWAYAFGAGFKSQAEIDDMIARALLGNYNAILPEVLAYHDTGGNGHGAYWNSSIVPKASDISPSSFDPLAYLVTEAHANGLEVHPWLVTYRACTSWPPNGNATLTAHPEWISVLQSDMGSGPQPISGKYELDPGSPDVQEYLISIVRELVTNYAVDGIHWDYIRYTNSGAGYPAHTWYTRSGLERFREITGYSGTPSSGYNPWEDFRRREVTELVRRAQVEMATIDSNPRQPLRHTAALITWGDAPSSFESTSAWGIFQNWREWMELGYLDAGIPMTYYDYDTYPSWYRNWVDQEMVWRYDRHIFVGPGIYLNDFSDSITEIVYARNAGADGICTYSYSGTYDGGTDWSWYSYVAGAAFTDPIATPTMPWRDPALASEGYVYGRVVDGHTGAPIDDATIKLNGATVAQTDGNGFYSITQVWSGGSGALHPVSAVATGFTEVTRPQVLVEPAGYTEANFALGGWLPGDYDVDLDVDAEDYAEFELALTGPDVGPPPAGGDVFDFNDDNDVDMDDFQLFQVAFTG